MEIKLNDLEKELPGLTRNIADYMIEACVVSLERHDHKRTNTNLNYLTLQMIK